MELSEAKIIAMVALGFGSLVAGLLPRWFSANSRNQRPLFISSLLCFGGGVLLSTSLIHMLPEIREAMPKYQRYAELIFCAGFFIVYVIDEVVHFFYGDTHNNSAHSCHCDNSHDKAIRRRHSFSNQPRSGYEATEYQPILHGNSSHSQFPYNPDFYGVERNNQNHSHNFWDDAPPSQLCHVGHQEPCDASPIGDVTLLVALSVHAILEGLAVGLQKSSSQVLLLLGAVASHKLVVGFCLGTELSSSTLSACRYFICIAVFSFGSVLGIIIGMIITEIPKRLLQVAFPVLQGLAAGTLLYVTVSEVLPRERARWHKHQHRKIAGILQFLSVTIGFVIMTIITHFLENREIHIFYADMQDNLQKCIDPLKYATASKYHLNSSNDD